MNRKQDFIPVNRVAKLLLANTIIEETQQSEQSGKSLLWSFRSCSCGVRAPPTHKAGPGCPPHWAHVTNGSWNVMLPHSAALLHIPQLHRTTRGTKTLPKNPIKPKKSRKTLYLDKEFQKIVRSCLNGFKRNCKKARID